MRNVAVFGSAQRRVFRLGRAGIEGAVVEVEANPYDPKQRSWFTQQKGWLALSGFSSAVTSQVFITPVFVVCFTVVQTSC